MLEKRLNRAWSHLGMTVVDKLGKTRRIVDKFQNVICDKGYQAEIDYLNYHHSGVLNG